MKKLIIALTFAISLPLFAADDAAREAARQAAIEGAAAATSKTLRFDANGNPVMGADGKPVMVNVDAGSMQNALDMFKGVTGVSSVSGAGGGMANVGVKKSVSFNCNDLNGTPMGAGALSFILTECQKSGTAVASADFLVCDKAERASACGSKTDYDKPIRVAAGQYSAFGPTSLGLGCNSAGTCLLTVEGTYSIGGSAGDLKQKSAEIAQGSDIVQGIKTAAVAQDYSGQMREQGMAIRDCVDANKDALATGEASTCGESPQKIQIGATAENPNCSQPAQCIQEAITTSTFTKSFSRSFPLTQRTSTYTYDQNATCTIETFADPKTTATNSCKPDENTDYTSGLTLVGKAGPACVETDDKNVCVKYKTTEYWAKTSDPSLASQSAYPSRVGGACDTSATSETRTFSCGAWFGRTLPADECKDQTLAGQAPDDSPYTFLSYAQKPGCGFCMVQNIGETCYAVPDPTPEEVAAGADEADGVDNAELDGCALTSATALTYSGTNSGLVTSQSETYSCTQSTTQCVQWANGGDSSCLNTNMTLGLENAGKTPATLDPSFNAAMVAAATANETTKARTAQQGVAYPLLFGGEALRCKRPTGGLSQVVTRDCCRSDLERPEKDKYGRNSCEMHEIKLAAAKRSRYATYVGSWCSRKIETWFFSYCLENSQGYCAFPGVLPRLIQEQGRAQLAAMAASSENADIQRASINYRYYDTGGGSWSSVQNVNGVRVAAWQWPSYCADPAAATKIALDNPGSKSCPGIVTTWFAACDIPSGCGGLPDDPMTGAYMWQLKDVNPLETSTVAISKYAVVRGACNTSSSSCAYTASAWPAGIGGRAVVTRDLIWPLAKPGASQEIRSLNIGDLLFQVSPLESLPNGTLPSTIPMLFSYDGGQSWKNVNLPTNLSNQDFRLPQPGPSFGPDGEVVWPDEPVLDPTITGKCDALKNVCEFRATATAVVSAKSWGSPQNPDCSGFSPGQMAVIDISKMNLSEWLATVMDKMSAKADQVAAGQAEAQFEAYYAAHTSGQVKSSAPSGAKFARVTPTEGFGPFTVKLSVSGFWPETTGNPSRDVDRITRVEVDWGVCGAFQALPPVAPSLGVGFQGSFQYNNPLAGSYGCVPRNSAGNLVHDIKVRMTTTKSGVQTGTLKVENVISKFSGGSGGTTGANVTTTVPAPSN